jgi:hypothetical protein
MDRKGQWMQIPRPFPPPTIRFVDETPARASRSRVRWPAVAFGALLSALAFALAWLVLEALR